MYNIKTLNNISDVGLKYFARGNYAVSGDGENPDAILVRSAAMHEMEFGDNLLCVARAGAGVNNIPIDRCADKGIVVFNTPGANAEAVKELAICAMLISSRDIVGGIQWVKTIADKGAEIGKLVEKGKSGFAGPELMGKSLGVIGLGAIGAKIATAALAMGMKVYGYDPYLSVDAAWGLSSAIIHSTNVDEIYANCDYITIHIPYMDSTRHFIGGEAIAKMKQDVRIINLARGELIDDDALIAGISSGKVAGYVTDFPNEKTANSPKVIAIPHLGASTPESEDNCAVMAAKQTIDYLQNGNIVNSVNMPGAVLPRTGDARVCIIHKNVPDMIAKITAIISSAGANIENMLNAGLKGKPHAYTMIDMDSKPDGLEELICKLSGVIRVRVI